MSKKTVPEKVEEFKEKNPDIMSMLLAEEMNQIYETGNAFDMIATAFFFGYMKGSKAKKKATLQVPDERKQIIEELIKEVEGINSIAMIRFILNVVCSFKKKWGAI